MEELVHESQTNEPPKQISGQKDNTHISKHKIRPPSNRLADDVTNASRLASENREIPPLGVGPSAAGQQKPP